MKHAKQNGNKKRKAVALILVFVFLVVVMAGFVNSQKSDFADSASDDSEIALDEVWGTLYSSDEGQIFELDRSFVPEDVQLASAYLSVSLEDWIAGSRLKAKNAVLFIDDEGNARMDAAYYVGEEVYIPTPFCTLRYSDEWSDYLDVSVSGTSDSCKVAFGALIEGEVFDLFLISIGEEQGVSVGSVANPEGGMIDVYLRTYDLSNYDVPNGSELRLQAMQEDLNYVLEAISFE